MSRNSITPSRAFLTIGVSVRISWPSAAGSAQLACGLGGPGFDLDQAHPAIAGDRQPLVIAEARDLLAGQLARLQHGRALRNLDLDAVDGDLGHEHSEAAAGSGGGARLPLDAKAYRRQGSAEGIAPIQTNSMRPTRGHCYSCPAEAED